MAVTFAFHYIGLAPRHIQDAARGFVLGSEVSRDFRDASAVLNYCGIKPWAVDVGVEFEIDVTTYRLSRRACLLSLSGHVYEIERRIPGSTVFICV